MDASLIVGDQLARFVLKSESLNGLEPSEVKTRTRSACSMALSVLLDSDCTGVEIITLPEDEGTSLRANPKLALVDDIMKFLRSSPLNDRGLMFSALSIAKDLLDDPGQIIPPAKAA